MLELIKNIGLGIVSGIVSAGIGYFRKTPVPEFSVVKFGRTVIIGAIVGGAITYSPALTEDIVVDFLQSMGYVTVIDRAVTLVYTRLKASWNHWSQTE